MVDFSRYSLETIGYDGRFVVLRGTSNGDSMLVMRHASSEPGSADISLLERTYSLREDLDPAWATQPIAWIRLGEHDALVLTDPGGVMLSGLLGGPLQIETFLRLAMGLCDAVSQFHARGLVHRDIKPAHVMVEVTSGRAWLTGAGLSLRVERQRQAPEPPSTIAGTLAYMAPEQTGRMNRSVDSRSDLYALGVTFYEMLTGSLPFVAHDPMELVHCHVARQPAAPAQRVSGLPVVLSDIVLKLLAKTAEERYQTALGVRADLERCLQEWTARAQLSPFEPGQGDISDRLIVPEKLYGREREVSSLLAAFERAVANATCEIAMVSGYSGIGKSSVVGELLKALVPPRSLFATGKFDQHQRDVPYATLAQAFRGLIRHILGEEEAVLTQWRSDLRAALGDHGQRMVDLIPELERVIGKQPTAPELPPQDLATLFRGLFIRFIGAFASAAHPLALFLDDLQWLDAATLDLLDQLATAPEAHHLLLIGAYRDNEVGPDHALQLRLSAMRKAGARVHDLVLSPLPLEYIHQLTMETLHSPAELTASLAHVVHEKAGGNPFFTIQFLTALAEDGLIWFDRTRPGFCWDVESIQAKSLADNVVHLVLHKIRRLPREARTVLRQLACLGSAAPASVLHNVQEAADLRGVHQALQHAVRAGLIYRSGENFGFLHDRIREAAYEQIPERERPAVHLKIGRLLLAATPAAQRGERVFDLTHQLNRGAALIRSRSERRQLAELNLLAAKRARSATAFASALSYLRAGEALLDDARWHDDYELAFELAFHRAECEFLTSDLASAEERLLALSTLVRGQIDRSRVTVLRMTIQISQEAYAKALEIGLAYLDSVDIHWALHPSQDEVGAELSRIHELLAGRPVPSLLDLPELSDPTWLATIEVLIEMSAPALFTDPALYALSVARQVNISIVHGNSEGSPLAYSLAAIVFGPNLGDYKLAEQFAELGCNLVQRGFRRFEARVYLVAGHHIYMWTRDVRDARLLIQRGLDSALRIGEVVYAGYTISHLITNDLASGRPLSETLRDARAGVEFARKHQLVAMVPSFVSHMSFVQRMRGLPVDYDVFADEAGLSEHLSSDLRTVVSAFAHWTTRQQLNLMLGNHRAAIEAEQRAQHLLPGVTSFFERAEHHYYGAVARGARFDEVTGDERAAQLHALVLHHERLQHWASISPGTFESRALLAAAELARVKGCHAEAQRHYEDAILVSRRDRFVHNEALAFERAASYYETCGYELTARTYLRAARQCYSRFGADAKVSLLDARYPELASERQSIGSALTIDAAVDQVDLATVLKVSEALFGELLHEKLMHTLMVTAVEHAGAQRALLILARNDELSIEAEAITEADAVSVQLRRGHARFPELSDAVLKYVTRTLDSVVLEDAAERGSFLSDPYLDQQRCRSLLCMPLVKQMNLIGVLYLENGLAPHVFTPARVAVLRLLASQAASSLDNARLYAELDHEYRARSKMQAELAHVTRVATLGEMAASIAHEVNQPLTAIVTNASACLRWLDREEITEARGTAQRIIRDGKRAAEVVSGLRSLFKKSEAVRASIDLNQVVADVLSFTRSELNKHNLLVATELRAGLPSVHGDRVQLQQVLLNLVLNACDAMRGVQDRERKLTLRTDRHEEWVRVHVHDTGSGIDPVISDTLFEAFHSTKDGGLGMGLSISRTIVEDHGGRIWAESPRGPGTIFSLELPAEALADALAG